MRQGARIVNAKSDATKIKQFGGGDTKFAMQKFCSIGNILFQDSKKSLLAAAMIFYATKIKQFCGGDTKFAINCFCGSGDNLFSDS